MNKEDLRIIFMGTPEFAVATLRNIVTHGYNVVAVVTVPDKPVGRHQNTLTPSPVKAFALQHGIPVLQPTKLKDPDFITALRDYKASLQVVVAFRMLPEVVWAMPPLGTFNLHGSLLPQYRGAAPINWPIINGDSETGITTFFISHDIDTGDIIQRATTPILLEDNAGTLHDRLMLLGANLVVETIQNLLLGTVSTIPQVHLSEGVTLHAAPKIFKETCRINWGQGLMACYNFVRGLSPYPGAWTELIINDRHTVLKIFASEMQPSEHTLRTGMLVTDNKTNLAVAVPGGLLQLTDIQLAGKKRMPIAAFLMGSVISPEAYVM